MQQQKKGERGRENVKEKELYKNRMKLKEEKMFPEQGN